MTGHMTCPLTGPVTSIAKVANVPSKGRRADLQAHLRG